MTTLLTESGALLRTTGPYQYSPMGYPSLPTSSVPFSSMWGNGTIALVGTGTTVSFSQLYREQPWLAVAINKLTRLVSSLPLKVYTRNGPAGGKKERVPHDHPLAKLLRAPYHRHGAVHLTQNLIFPTLLHGNSLIAKYRDEPGGPPTALLPLDWRFVNPVALTQNGPVEFWETTQTGDRRFIPVDDTLHVAWRSPESDLGVSPLQQLGVTIRVEDAAQRYQTSSFDNGARPAGALVLPPESRLSEAERRELRAEIQASHGGVDNAFKLALLSGGMDWKPFGQTAVEAALIEQRKLNREEIAAVYDIPPPLIGILDHATYSNVQEMGRLLFKQVLLPWLTLVQDTIAAHLIDPEPSWDGLFVEFDMDEQLKGDPLDRAKAQSLWITHGVYVINEIRDMEGLPRIDNPVCDEPLIPVNNLGSATSLNPQLETPLDGGTAPQDGDETADPTTGPLLSSHIARAGDRVFRKMRAGHPRPFDRDRFVRELKHDAPAVDAGRWADCVEAGLDWAGGDAAVARELFKCLSGGLVPAGVANRL